VADVGRHTEDWQTLPWKEFQRNVYRLQKAHLPSHAPWATTRHTVNGADDNSLRAEEPREGKAFKRGSELAAGWATAPPTITGSGYGDTIQMRRSMPQEAAKADSSYSHVSTPKEMRGWAPCLSSILLRRTRIWKRENLG
jgi:hypothetical protein